MKLVLLKFAFAAWLGLVSLSAASAAASAPVILILGDSLSAGYGVSVDATWVALLQQRLAKQGYGYRVVNASVSGETTGGARARLPRALEVHKPAIVIVELGGNDGLRGLPLKQVRDNIDTMLRQISATGGKPVLVAMRIPTNYGPAYTTRFHGLYGELGQEHGVPVIDGFMDSVALDEKLMQSDGIHPNAQAQPVLLDVIWPTLSKQLKK